MRFSEAGLWLVEAKATGFFASKLEKGRDGKVRKVKKDVDKGLNQLEGATKQPRRNNRVVDSAGNEMVILSQPEAMHTVVIVSEMLNFGDWS